MPISHAGHDHPATPAARAACRKAMAKLINDGSTMHESFATSRADQAKRMGKPAEMTVVPRRRGDGGVVKGHKATSPKASSRNTKKPNTVLRTIGDLPDVPRMLAYGVRLAWANEWEARVGDPFNDTEARIVVTGPVAEIALVWRPSLPDGVWGVFVRNWDSSVTHRIGDVQTAFALAGDAESWTSTGTPIL